MRENIQKYGLVLSGIVGITLLTGILAYLGSLAGTPRTGTRVLAPFPTPTPAAGFDVLRFARVDPAIVDVLDLQPQIVGAGAPDVLGIEPVGAYLSTTGNTQFTLMEPTPMPTPLPFPTAQPLPLPAPQQIPTLEPSGDRALPYGGDGCAPAGNPVDGILTQRYHRYHNGIDIGVPLNTPVLATHSGEVIFADWSAIGYGYLVIIENGNFITYYAHNTSFNVDSGDFVGKGSLIAWSGSTGNSTGPHVHYEVRINDVTVDPLTFAARGFASC